MEICFYLYSISWQPAMHSSRRGLWPINKDVYLRKCKQLCQGYRYHIHPYIYGSNVLKIITIVSNNFAKSKLYFCPDIGNAHCFAVKLTTKSLGSSIYWKIGSSEEERICNGVGYDDNQEYVDQCCLSPGRYQLICEHHGNSNSLQGGYIEIDGKRYCEGYLEDGNTEEIIRRGINRMFKNCIQFTL